MQSSAPIKASGSPTRAFCRKLPVIALWAILLGAGGRGGAQTIPSLTWKCSTQAAPWTDMPAVAMSATVPLPTDTSAFRMYFNSTQTGQTIDGWGGCFNERGWKALSVLSSGSLAAVMQSMFDPQLGLKLNYGRTPIGSNDYSIAPFSYDETAGDYSMSNFSIQQDGQYLIPYIKSALAIRPDLNMWAVPWTPPSWMKANDSLINGGNILDDNQTLDALALYFVRYLQAYEAQGINIGMVMPQNEPNISNNYPSCNWTGVQLSNFIGYHLGPALANAGLGQKIFLGTMNDSSRGGYSYWIAPSIQDPQTNPYISGVACQWSADQTMAEMQIVLPGMKLMQSEAECGSTNSNDWAFGQYQYELALKWFGDGASTNIVWNLVLDQTGLSNGGWAQCSPIVVNSQTGQVTYTPYYYLYKHFSYFIQPGAHYITGVYSTWGDKMAFVNPDGSIVAVIQNSASSSYNATLNFNGMQSAEVTLPANSISTFVLPGPGTSITSPLSATATNGVNFSYQITGTNSPSSFTATGLPSGLSINRANGLIFGTSVVSGTFPVTISAATSGGSASATLALTVLPPLPVITSGSSMTVKTGQGFSYTITASGNPVSYGALNLPPGLSFNSSSGVISGTTTISGTSLVTISAANSSGTSSSALTIVSNPTPYSIWESQVFSIADLGNPAISGANATPAGDGIANLIKYALNLKPKVDSIAGLPGSITISTGSNSYLALTFTKVIAATDLTYTVQVSNDLSVWNSGSGYTAAPVAVTNPDGVTQTVTVESLVPLSVNQKQFIRLQISK